MILDNDFQYIKNLEESAKSRVEDINSVITRLTIISSKLSAVQEDFERLIVELNVNSKFISKNIVNKEG